ncbi:MAG: endo-1,4-beta-xylanase [Treponema sp.]|nr:endo-1,4-beta-xylanase [Treponema sp.]
MGLLAAAVSCNKPEEEFVPEPWDAYGPLHEIYQDKFLIGNIIRNSGDFANATRSGILKRHYKIVTAENDMKPNYLAPSVDPGSASATWNYRFTTADTIVNRARAEGFAVHAHTLIWYSQSPTWLAEGGEEYLNKFVTDVVTHFKGRVISWDVVNEAFRDGLTEANAADWKSCLRPASNAPWNKSIGPEYIEKAFLAARAADPDVKLYYNDYGMNGIGKRLATYNMVKEINEKYPDVGGRPLIDGIGMQSHHHLNTDPETVRASIEKFVSLGLEVGITEMDIIAANWPGLGLGAWDENAAQKQAAQYAAMFRVFIDNSRHISRVTFWGLDDGTSWRGGQRDPNDGGSSGSAHPTLLDKDYNIKPAFHAVMYPDRY